jgi:C4-dicarboxylate-specific signal transduction histidine kinase
MASPLSAITVNIERLRASLPVLRQIRTEQHYLTSEASELLSEIPSLTSDIDQSAHYLVQLINGIREHWRPPNQDATADVKAVTEFVKRMLSARARQMGISLVFDVMDVPRVKMAPSNLCQVVINLLMNAIQAFDENIQRREVCLRVRPEGAEALFTVLDTGKGIDANVLTRLGKEPVTTKAPGEGMGVGLLSSRALILRTSGRFQVTHTSDEGTKVEFWLPFA